VSDSEGARPVAIVTGGSRGIGRAIALRLAADGHDVAVTYGSDEAGAAETVNQLEAAGARALAIKADVRDPEAVGAAFEQVTEQLGAASVLVNNAGVRNDTLAVRMSDQEWGDTIDVNLSGAFNCARAALRPMMRARHGRIINVSSVAGVMGNPGQVSYSASKAGLIGMTRTLAREYARKGITVNAVAPGPVATAMTEGVVEGLVELVPVGRAGTPEEVAAAVAFLASDDAAYVNGVTLPVDGGMTA
jgi:3-oxoacyl-[acyl-carrier protein] reductase